jgi:Sulfotransferase family
MFFIFGSPRSGTTLLAQCLNNHPDIAIPHETDFIIPLAFVCDRIADPATGKAILTQLVTRSTAFRASIGEYLSEARVAEVIAASPYQAAHMIEALYSDIAAAAKAGLAGDKSPNDLLFLRMLIKVGGIAPDTKIVHLVRDVRDVMVSLRQTGWLADVDVYFARFWSNSNLYLHSLYRDQSERYALVRYEDMVREPQAWLRQICVFLGVAYRPEMLDSSRFHSRYRTLPHQAKLYAPISTENVGVFRGLDPSTILLYETQAREALEVFGYPLSEPERGLVGFARRWWPPGALAHGRWRRGPDP